MSSEAHAALTANLRNEIAQRVTDQHQLLVVAAAIAGGATAFAGTHFNAHPELLALLSLLFVGFALAMLRHDHEITIIASHLVKQVEFGSHARAQERWEKHRYEKMQASGWIGYLVTASQTVGLYGVPVLAAVAFAWAALATSPNTVTWLVIALTSALGGLFLVGAFDVVGRYRVLGKGKQTDGARRAQGESRSDC
jgi:hypothetical protein